MRIAIGTSTQYPRTSRIGAMVVPPRDKSAKPTVIVASAATQSAIDLVRGLIRASGEDELLAPVSDIAR